MLESGLSSLVPLISTPDIVRLAMIFFFVSLLFTYNSALLTSLLPTSEKRDVKEPQKSPQGVPYGAVLSLIFNPERFLRRLQ